MARRIKPTPIPSSPEINSVRDLGAHIRGQRTRDNMRIDDAALLCNVSVQLLSDLETGRRAVSLEKALGVARNFGIALLAVTLSERPYVLAAVREADKRNAID
jgi:transcriptional regulator with XRE-family HTH domain